MGRAGAAALVLVLLSRLVILLAYHPDTSDVDYYERYAGVVAAMAAEKLSLPSAQGDGLEVGGLAAASSSKIVEYPPLAIAFMAAAGLGATQPTPAYPDAYADRYRLAVFAIDVLVLVALTAAACLKLADRNASRRTLIGSLAVYGIGGVALAYLYYDRLDLVVGALLLFSLLLLLNGSWRSSFVLLALAVGFKAVPLVLAPLWVVGSVPTDLWVRATSVDLRRLARVTLGRTLFLLGVSLVLFVPFLAAVGPRAVDFVRFNGMRGVQIESTASSILLVLHMFGVPIEIVPQFGAVEIVSAAVPLISALSPILVALAALAATAAYVRSRRGAGDTAVDPTGPSPASPQLLAASDPEGFVAATLLILLITLVLSKVLSPQYLLWLVPLVPLLAFGPLRGRLFQIVFLAGCFVSTLIFPIFYLREFERLDASGVYLDPGGLGVALLLVRNGILVGLALLVAWPLVRRRGKGGPTSAGGETANDLDVAGPQDPRPAAQPAN